MCACAWCSQFQQMGWFAKIVFASGVAVALTGIALHTSHRSQAAMAESQPPSPAKGTADGLPTAAEYGTRQLSDSVDGVDDSGGGEGEVAQAIEGGASGADGVAQLARRGPNETTRLLAPSPPADRAM